MKSEPRTVPDRAIPTLSPDGDRAFTPPIQRAPASAGVWLLMAVITVMFFLFTVAYRIRMNLNDWQPMSEPWQLGVSTLLLVLSCVTLHLCCRKAALLPSLQACRSLLQLAVSLTLGFVLAQLWVWQQLLALNIRVGQNPANSFFYLLTGLHGVHVLGGLVALGWVIYHAGTRHGDALYPSLRLCARYWHFLLLIWLFLLGLFRLT
ncbi:cytochrome c oxidase subunit 3 [Photobacterium sp. MCCC 1A19761]|uniref:cytochrome c oxidase subunit 3 n=1 Tax=Photobacterium sp. MCCC 1A19761 TaxID=3115000 RepID=UPI00307CF463